MTSSRLTSLLASRRIAVMLPLGFFSGLPLALTSGATLQAWLSTAGTDIRTIGWFTLVGLPYTLKFLWAPVMDRCVPPWLGRRRGWMVVAQVAVAASLTAMAMTGPTEGSWQLGVLAMLAAFLAASLDIVFDAYRTDLLQPEERGFGAALWVNGYRVALIVAGVFALMMADRIGWQNTYLALAGLMLAGTLAILYSPEPTDPGCVPSSWEEAVWGPLEEYFSRSRALWFLWLIVLYKLGDAFAGTLTTPFLIKELQFSATDVGMMRGIGLGATLIGALIGGIVMVRLGLFQSLLAFGLLQAVSNLSFVALAWIGKSYGAAICTIVIENLSGGMGTSAFVALVMSLCDHRFTATQFALLSSVEALGRVFLGRPAAELVQVLGWGPFFFLTFLAALPGLGLLWWMHHSLSDRPMESQPHQL